MGPVTIQFIHCNQDSITQLSFPTMTPLTMCSDPYHSTFTDRRCGAQQRPRSEPARRSRSMIIFGVSSITPVAREVIRSPSAETTSTDSFRMSPVAVERGSITSLPLFRELFDSPPARTPAASPRLSSLSLGSSLQSEMTMSHFAEANIFDEPDDFTHVETGLRSDNAPERTSPPNRRRSRPVLTRSASAPAFLTTIMEEASPETRGH